MQSVKLGSVKNFHALVTSSLSLCHIKDNFFISPIVQLELECNDVTGTTTTTTK